MGVAVGLYTTVYLTPDDSAYIASDAEIRAIARLLEAPVFDIFTVSRETAPYTDPEEFDEDRYEDVFRCGNTPIDETLQHHRAGGGYSTHMMFPFGDFMKSLAKEIDEAIPQSLSDRYVPWDTSISNGRWSTVSYDEGVITAAGCFAVCLSGHGCPMNLERYLELLNAVSGFRELRSKLESITGQRIQVRIELS